MAKKIAGIIVEPKTDHEKLAELIAAPQVPAMTEELPTPQVDMPPVIPQTPVSPQTPTVTPEDVLTCLDSNPALLADIFARFQAAQSKAKATAPKTRQAYNAGSATAVPSVRKSTQKAGFVEFSFSEKPDEMTRTELKGAGYRWSKFNGVWYGPAATLASHARFGSLVQAAIVS